MPTTEWAGMTDWIEARGRETEKLRDENDEKGRHQPKTEWAGMTDWVKTVE